MKIITLEPTQYCLFCDKPYDGNHQHLRWVKASDQPRPIAKCLYTPEQGDRGRNGDGGVTTRVL